MHQIIRATTEDFELAKQAICEVHERQLLDDAALAAFLRDPSCHMLLAVENGRVGGGLSGYALRRPESRQFQFLLYEIDVRPECRRQGVGTALVQRFDELARTDGANEVWVLTGESNAAAVALYQKCGYCRSNVDDVMMEKAL